MAERRSLREGIRQAAPAVPRVEEQFVYGPRQKAGDALPGDNAAAEPREGKGPPGGNISRVPLTTRIRSDYAAALKQASLKRQLEGVYPNTLQDLLEEALGPWLRQHGYLS